MRKRGVATIVLLFVLGALLPLTGGLASAGPRSYVVVYKHGVTLAQARAAVAAAGGTIVKENRAVGVATAISSRSDFLSRALRQPALFGATKNRVIGSATAMSGPEWLKAEQLTPSEKREAVRNSSRAEVADAAPGEEPLANLQWDMQMIHATTDGS